MKEEILPDVKKGKMPLKIIRCGCKDTAKGSMIMQMGSAMLHPCRRCYRGLKADILSDVIQESSKSKIKKYVMKLIRNVFHPKYK